jgi:glutamate--cysteine ligase
VSAPSQSGGAPIESKDELVRYLESGCRPKAEFKIGTEHEKFAFRKSDLKRPGYEGADGIRAIFEATAKLGWEPNEEAGNLVLLRNKDGASITFEPGGQLELSGAPLDTVHQTCNEVNTHLYQMKQVGEELGVGLLGLGFDPKWAREEVPWMPRERHLIMRRYMPKRGELGHDMMIRSSTIQVNLDFESEADMVRKMRVSLALQPIATALFANSPFSDGKPNGYMSYRSHVWTDTDPDRCGPLPFAFESGFSFERYVDYALDVPMYFVYRDGDYIDVAGKSFRDFLAGKLEGLEGELPTITDWDNHLTTLFPDVRMKRYIEQRGADGGPWRRICALPALWVGLLYDSTSLDAASDLIADWTEQDREQLRLGVPKHGLKAPFDRRQGGTAAVARCVLEIARKGLEARGNIDSKGRSEAHFLETLEEFVERGESPAAHMLRLFEDEWGGNIDSVYQEAAY